MSTTKQSPSSGSESGPWAAAGEAWGHAAADWAYRFEPHARDAVEVVLRRVDVGPGTRLLDVACGAGYGLGVAARRGAVVSGVDASAPLLEIAARRAPDADLVHGDMFDLPWSPAAFDVAVACNGVWGGCRAAVEEMVRVTRPGGFVALIHWGAPDRLDLLGYFLAVGAAGPGVAEEISSLAEIGRPGIAEEMLGSAGAEVVDRGSATAVLEFSDAGAAWAALRSPGLVVPALDHTGEAELRRQVLAAIEPHRAPDGSYRLANRLDYVVATVSQAHTRLA